MCGGTVCHDTHAADAQRVVDVADVFLYVVSSSGQLFGYALLVVLRVYHFADVAAGQHDTVQLSVFTADGRDGMLVVYLVASPCLEVDSAE